MLENGINNNPIFIVELSFYQKKVNMQFEPLMNTWSKTATKPFILMSMDNARTFSNKERKITELELDPTMMQKLK
jgi:hypothetical protein